jgi:hypothetical protein
VNEKIRISDNSLDAVLCQHVAEEWNITCKTLVFWECLWIKHYYGLKWSLIFTHSISCVGEGRAMAQAVSRRPLTTEARVRSQFKSMWDLWWTKWQWNRFFSELSVFPCRFHSTGAPLLVKLGKKTAHPHIHHRGCTISLKAAVRP